ncbi:CheR family methyltransferase [Pseudoneobacillus sp. C159]
MMQDFGLDKLSELVYDYCGLRYFDRLSVLKDKTTKRLLELGVSSYWDYCSFIKKNKSEWDILVEILTINETYFYREESQLVECCSVILPQLKEQIKNRPIRIWSAACSSGEEPYTIGMLLQESGNFKNGEIEIIATDINKKVLEKAKKGWYHQGSFAFRRIPKPLMDKYFSIVDGGYKISETLQKMVEFKYLNLLDEGNISQIGEVDIIFCRNVLIYFDQDTIKRVIGHLHQNLKPNGYLFLGHAESITELGLGFKKVDSDKTFYYRKELD